jgi:hypothetical protein
MLPFIQCHHTLGHADLGGFAKASCTSDCAGTAEGSHNMMHKNKRKELIILISKIKKSTYNFFVLISNNLARLFPHIGASLKDFSSSHLGKIESRHSLPCNNVI